MDGQLISGQTVVEAKWGSRFGVAQASVREAINLLVAEGFLVKDAGRSARVVNYREADVTHIYEVRAAIEGQAAHLACARSSDLSRLESALERMHHAATSEKVKELIQSDLDFHVALTQAPDNPILAEFGAKLLFPLFAFIQIRVLSSGQGTQAWTDDMESHRSIVNVIRQGNPNLAGQFVHHCIRRFAGGAYKVWGNVGGPVEAPSRPRNSGLRGRHEKSLSQ